MSLYERITEALNGTTPECPPVAIEKVGDRWLIEGDSLTVADARLILTAPGLLAECAQRLTELEALVKWLASGTSLDEGEEHVFRTQLVHWVDRKTIHDHCHAPEGSRPRHERRPVPHPRADMTATLERLKGETK